MCTLSLNAERILVKLTDGVSTGCHLTWRTTPKRMPLQLWAFERLSVRSSCDSLVGDSLEFNQANRGSLCV